MLISDLKTRIQSKIHGKSLNKVQDVYNVIYEAAGNLLLRIDPYETKRKSTLTLEDQVFSYSAPIDLKGDKIIDIRPVSERTALDDFSQTYQAEFDQYKTDRTFAVEMNSGIKTLRISASVPTEGVDYEIIYYSKYLFRNLIGDWIEKPSEETDSVNLDTDTINLLIFEISDILAQQNQGEDGAYDGQYWDSKRKEAYALYGFTYKSEIKKPKVSYYRRLR